MNILITGATGFIGSHLVERLIKEKQYNLILIKRKNSNIWRIKDFIDNCKVYDYENLDDIELVFKENKIDLIIHLATKYIKNDENSSNIKEMIDSNIVFPTFILELAKKNNVNYFINTGTCFEYKITRKLINEKSKIQSYNFYASSKLAFEKILEYYCEKQKIKGVTLKLFYPFGEKDNDNKLITKLIKSIILKEEFYLTKGEQILNFTYVKDIVEAYIKLLKKIKSFKRYEVFNIASNEVISVKKIVKLLCNFDSNAKKIIFLGKIPYQENEIFYIKANIDKAKKILSWHPQYSIEEGLKKTYEYYVKNFLNN